MALARHDRRSPPTRGISLFLTPARDHSPDRIETTANSSALSVLAALPVASTLPFLSNSPVRESSVAHPPPSFLPVQSRRPCDRIPGSAESVLPAFPPRAKSIPTVPVWFARHSGLALPATQSTLCHSTSRLSSAQSIRLH